jgi:hypothetical protein
MPFKDPEKRRENQRRHYAENKERYRETERKRRGTQPKPDVRELVVIEPAVERIVKPKRREPELEAEQQRLIAVQRNLKADAMRRLGIKEAS